MPFPCGIPLMLSSYRRRRIYPFPFAVMSGIRRRPDFPRFFRFVAGVARKRKIGPVVPKMRLMFCIGFVWLDRALKESIRHVVFTAIALGNTNRVFGIDRMGRNQVRKKKISIQVMKSR